MFGGLSRVFRDDPFFQDSFAAHREHMDRIFSEPFGPSPFFGGERIRNAIKDGGERTRDQGGCPDSRVALKDSHKNMDFRDPFSTMDRMMSNMRNTMMELQQNFDKMSIDPNSHSFVSSSVMTYSKTGDEPPKVFQASAQTRRAPGGIKETRKSVKDSESGLEKMAVGHHIQDRAHVIQKAKNSKTGDEELNQEFLNLDEAEAHAFDEEWQKEITRYKPSAARNRIDTPRPRSIHRVSREDGARREKALPRTAIEGPRKPKSAVEALNVKGSHVPLKSSKK
ncbi:myeloid leukemia factor 1 isoform X3 [Eublepharis macularius]|uniref:Myeloid leukemia factor 1 isoform X3 n=1 Tax=Eublepharis macularius TaxID=481883 RepID=A0AA97JJ95_EUBMA|nr:myeloid leukemia factor 1 isoform X3 [Eublepharis macularius]